MRMLRHDRLPEGVPAMTERLLNDLDVLAETSPDAVALIDANADTMRRTSWYELQVRYRALAADLRQRGVVAGGAVAVWLPNWSDAIVWQLAAAHLGAHVVGVNTRYNVREVAHVLRAARPSIIAVAHGFRGLDFLPRLREAAAVSLEKPAVAVISGPHGGGAVSVRDYDLGMGAWAPSMTAPSEVARADLGDQAKLMVAFTTSGSTGDAKLAGHWASAVRQHARADAAALALARGDVAVCILPLSGVFGFNLAYAALAVGATCLLEETFDERVILEHIAACGGTHMAGGDDMLARLLDAWVSQPTKVDSLRWVGVADFIGRSEEVARWGRDHAGAWVTGVYGSSEIMALAMSWPPDTDFPEPWRGGGQPIPGLQVRIWDRETASPARRGVPGELQFRGTSVVNEYLGDPSALQSSLTPDDWFSSGDLGVQVRDNAYTYVCRMEEVLRLSGFLVHPGEIEERLSSHPAVELAKVVGVTDSDGHSVPIAFVTQVAGREVSARELIDWCASAIAKYKVPRIVHLVADLPTTAGTNGSKIRIRDLRDLAQRKWDEEAARRR